MKRYSLCIGNNDYSKLAKLDYAVNDAKEIGVKLSELGFINSVYENVDNSEIGCVSDFVDSINEDETDAIVIYYAGHGIEIDGKNYLLPVDYPQSSSKGTNIQYSYALEDLVNELSKLSEVVKIIILDACRTGSIRGINGSGFAPIYAPKNTIIAFSTSPNQSAKEDDDNKHGFYTGVLLSKISTPFLSVEEMLKEVRKEVIDTTNGEQVPWEHTSLVKNFYFNRESIYKSISYSGAALKDKDFVFSDIHSPIKEIVDVLKGYNFYNQNAAIGKIYCLSPEYDYSINELFILGRNIYQSAEGNSWRAQDFIKEFDSWGFPLHLKHHILNGIAYEMYFDSNNNLRENYKSGFLEEVIGVLENEKFVESRDFIAANLAKHNERLLYIPGQKFIMQLKIDTHVENDIIMVDKILYSGIVISSLSEALNVERARRDSFKSILSKRLMCPSVSLLVNANNSSNGDSIFEFESMSNFKIL